MKLFLIGCAVAAVAAVSFLAEKKPHSKTEKKNSTSFAVLELFTSEGCSSCPPADKLLAQLSEENQNIIPLSFHVDYWDNLGWKDKFSNADYTERQRKYRDAFHLESIYTPQLIINGEYELVGSDRAKAESVIQQVLKESFPVKIKLDNLANENNKVVIAVTLTGDFKNSDLIAALVQNHAENNIRGGENNGAKLSHINIVRSLIQKKAEGKMNLEIPYPKDLTIENWKIILYVQQKNNLKITGVIACSPDFSEQ